MKGLITGVLGFVFGAILIASQAFEWGRIQEMFHFESFHMFGLILSAIVTAAISLVIIKKWKIKSVYGNEIVIHPKPIRKFGNIVGGLSYGLGWGLTGACAGPVFILIGIHWSIGLIVFVGAVLGTVLYGLLKEKLPE